MQGACSVPVLRVACLGIPPNFWADVQNEALVVAGLGCVSSQSLLATSFCPHAAERGVRASFRATVPRLSPLLNPSSLVS